MKPHAFDDSDSWPDPTVPPLCAYQEGRELCTEDRFADVHRERGDQLENTAQDHLDDALARSRAMLADPLLRRMFEPPPDPILEAEFISDEID